MAAAETTKTPSETTKTAPKSAVEPFAFAGAKAFRESVEKSVAAVSEINAHSKKNIDAVVASATAAAKGAETIGARAVAYSKKSMEDHVAVAKSLAAAKSVQEVFELQSAFAKSAFEGYVAEANSMAETLTASVKASFSPLNERVTAFVERVQTTR